MHFDELRVETAMLSLFNGGASGVRVLCVAKTNILMFIHLLSGKVRLHT